MTTRTARAFGWSRPLVAATMTSLAACSVVVDTSGLYGGSDGEPPEDASRPDTGTSSGGDGAPPPTTDAATDGRTDALDDGSVAGLCADAGSALCDDFDKSTTIGAQWTKVEMNGTVTIEATGLSTPNALSMTQKVGGGYALLSKTIAFSKVVHCEFDLKLDPPPSIREMDYFTLRTAGVDHEIYLAHFDTGFALAEYKENGADRNVDVPSPPIGSWFHVVFDTDGANATIVVDGKSATLANILQATGTSRAIEIGCGYAGNISSQAHALYDNVVCTPGN